MREVISDIARALAPETSSWTERLDASLALGGAGVALFYAYSHLCGAVEGAADAAEGWLGPVLSKPLDHPSLFSGFAGPAWLLAHLQGKIFDLGLEDWSSEVDQELLREAGSRNPAVNWDLVKGLAGSAVCWLERPGHAAARAGMERLVQRFAALAEADRDGLTWRYPAAALSFAADRERHPEGIYNISIAHGMPGILAALAGAAASGIEPGEARRLLAGGMRWLMAHEQPAEEPSAFPMSYEPGDIDRGRGQDIRLAWCQGDAGIAATLLCIAQTVRDPGWEAAALRIALRASGRRNPEAMAHDPCLCHGTAGLAHLFNRMYQRTGAAELAEAARHWLSETLSLLRSDLPGTAGFWSWQKTHGTHGDLYRREEPGFLLGAAGVGLALLAAVSHVEPAWDRLLLASLAPESGSGG